MATLTVSEALALAVEQHRAGLLAQAEQIYRAILQAAPQQVDALRLLGVIAYQRGEYEQAIASLCQALQLKPDCAMTYNSLGVVFKAQGRFVEAANCFQQALHWKPDYAEVHNNLGNVLKDQGRLEEALSCYQQALRWKPDYAEAHNNLGNVLKDQGRLEEALSCYQQALRWKPDYAEAHNNLGNVLKDQGRLEEALRSYRQALQLQPRLVQVHSNLVYTLHFCADTDAATLYEEHRRWDHQHAEPLAPLIQPLANDRASDRRLRIGYVSPDFREHPVGRFLLPLLKAHDHTQFDIFCYSSLAVPDGITEQCRTYADGWRDVFSLADEQLAQLIRQDHIDILVDLSMHMANNRLLVFARKPAPVQVTYLAYCGTTGLRTMDYRLTDPFLDPPDRDERYYTERSIRLPETYWCYQPPDDSPPVSPLPAWQSGGVTFGCLNNFCKVTAPTLVAWSHLLQLLPQARLLLYAQAGSHRDQVRDYFANQGIASDRVRFVGRVPLTEYMRLYQEVDVALDPFPYGGGTTTCDALWMGVPVISRAGSTAVSRSGLSILSNVGLAELVAFDGEQYVQRALELAQDLPRLSVLRASLRQRMQDSPLMDAPRFARNVEAAYRSLWNIS
jgi:protein O-GlcNAc transferase